MTEYSWEHEIPYTENLQKFHRDLFSQENSNKNQKFKYSEIIHNRIAEKFKNPHSIYINFIGETLNVNIVREVGAGMETVYSNNSFNAFLEWLDND